MIPKREVLAPAEEVFLPDPLLSPVVNLGDDEVSGAHQYDSPRSSVQVAWTRRNATAVGVG